LFTAASLKELAARM